MHMWPQRAGRTLSAASLRFQNGCEISGKLAGVVSSTSVSGGSGSVDSPATSLLSHALIFYLILFFRFSAT